MKPRYRLRSLLGLVTATAVGVGLLRGFIWERGPAWGLYLIGLTSIFAGIVAIVVVTFDPQPNEHR